MGSISYMKATRLALHREVAADPASLALLLALPGGAWLWPSVAGAEPEGGRMLVDAELPGRGPVRVEVRTGPPERDGDGIRATFRVLSAELPALTGEVHLVYRVRSDERPRTEVMLTLYYWGRRPGLLQQLAEAFLDRLTAAAQLRSRAA